MKKVLLILFFTFVASCDSEKIISKVSDDTFDCSEYEEGGDCFGDDLFNRYTDTDYAHVGEVAREPAFPNDEQLKTIGRLAERIPKWKKKYHRSWFECGEEYKTEPEEENAALDWAYRIVQLAWEYSDDEFEMNPWGIAGVVANESGFDRCALGPHFRKLAYKKGVLKKKRGFAISHTKEELKDWLLRPNVMRRYRITGFDAGPVQELWICNTEGMCRSRYWSRDTSSIPFDEMFTLGVQFEWGVREMRRRSRVWKTNRPWLVWRGKPTPWYDRKITKLAKKLGAKKGEI